MSIPEPGSSVTTSSLGILPGLILTFLSLAKRLVGMIRTTAFSDEVL